MTKEQYRAAIRRLGLSQVEAAKFVGVSPRTSRRYALGESKIPAAVVKLLEIRLKEEKQ